MAVNKVTNTFKKLDTDTSFNKQSNSNFYDGVDLRLISDEALSNGALVNFKGTKAKIDLGSKDCIVKGYTAINDTLVLLLYFNTGSPYSAIATVELTTSATVQPIFIAYSDASSAGKLGFGTVDSISVVGKYESDTIKKVYFAVENYPVRYFNVVQPSTQSYEVSFLDIIPNIGSGSIEQSDITVIDGGNLLAGKIQYVFKLLKKAGAETSFSTPTNLISLTADNPREIIQFSGSDISVNTAKSIKVTLKQLSSDFDYIRLYSIHYAEQLIPTISLVGEVAIPDTTTPNTAEVTIVDSGIALENITLEEFNSFGGRFFSASELATKNNMLFAANLVETTSIFDLDCRAYRFPISGGVCVATKLYQADDSYYILDPSGNWEYFNSSGVSTGITGTDWSIPETADCINKYNDEFLMNLDDNSLTHPHENIYGDFGGTPDIGGSGKYVNYTFSVDGGGNLINGSGFTEVSPTNDTYNSVIAKSSFKQGETYRVGLTFYDLKGKPYFTKWVGDIRMPYRTDTLATTTGSPTTSIGHLQLQVSVYLTDVDVSEVSGFHVSTVERTASDQSIVCQGATWIAAVDPSFTNNVAPYVFTHKSKPLKLVSDDGGYIYPKSSWDDYLLNDYENVKAVSNNSVKDYIHPFYSPELYFNGGIDSFSGDYIAKIVRVYKYKNKCFRTREYTTQAVDIDAVDCSFNKYGASSLLYPYTQFNAGASIVNVVGGVTSVVGATYTIIDSQKLSRVSAQEAPTIFNYGNSTASVQFHNRVLPFHQNAADDANHMTGYAPSCGVFTTKVPLAKRSSDDYVYVVDIYQNNATSRYGGNTYQARELNVYKPAGSRVLIMPPYYNYMVLATLGDSYNCIFDGFISYIDPNIIDQTEYPHYYANSTTTATLRQQVAIILPVESKINCGLSALKPSKYILNALYAGGKSIDEPFGRVALQETVAQGVELYGSLYPTKLGDTIKYNTAYSAVGKYPTLLPKPTLFDVVTVMPCTIVASEMKTPGELVDEWTRFLYNNILDVDNQFGAIHNLQHFNNKLYFFQEDAVGVASVNERYILNQDTASQLALGTGGVLERFDYLKYNEGILKRTHIIATNDSIYYLDGRRNVLTDITSTDVPLSMREGINSLVRALYTSSSVAVAFGYNPKHKEVLFTIGAKTLVFNEHYNAFAPRHSYVPSIYLSLPSELFSFTPVITKTSPTTNYVFKHGAGDYGEVYSENSSTPTARSEAALTFIVNPDSTSVAAFDSIDFRTEVYASGKTFNDGDLPYETVSAVDFRNSYQHATKTIIPKNGTNAHPNASRLARRWSTTVPLVADSSTTKEVLGNSKRMIDTFLMVTMKFQNNTSKKFRLHDVITLVR